MKQPSQWGTYLDVDEVVEFSRKFDEYAAVKLVECADGWRVGVDLRLPGEGLGYAPSVSAKAHPSRNDALRVGLADIEQRAVGKCPAMVRWCDEQFAAMNQQELFA
jgi:uncharacterized protein YciU (UPF0263 family)